MQHHDLITGEGVRVHADLGVEAETIMMHVDNRKCDTNALFINL